MADYNICEELDIIVQQLNLCNLPNECNHKCSRIKLAVERVNYELFKNTWAKKNAEKKLSWEEFYKTIANGLRSLRCGCGQILRTVEAVRNHWDMGHFQK